MGRKQRLQPKNTREEQCPSEDHYEYIRFAYKTDDEIFI